MRRSKAGSVENIAKGNGNSGKGDHRILRRGADTGASTMPAGRVRTARCEIRSVARDGATAQAAGRVSRSTRHSPRCRPSREAPPKALADRNGLATPATRNRFSVAARQWQRSGIGRWVPRVGVLRRSALPRPPIPVESRSGWAKSLPGRGVARPRVATGIVNLSGCGMFVVTVARRLGSGNSFARLLCCPAQAERGAVPPPQCHRQCLVEP